MTADQLIKERIGCSPGPACLMAMVLEVEEDPGDLADIYCHTILQLANNQRPSRPKVLMLKGKPASERDPSISTGTAQPPPKENPAVNAKINDYIKANPEFWEHDQSLPPERLARALVLVEMQKDERVEKLRAGVLRKLEENPEMKESIQRMVKNLPVERHEQAMVSIVRQTIMATAPKKAPSVGVRM